MFVGESGIGAKTSLINKIINDNFSGCPLPTSGAYFLMKKINLSNGEIRKLFLWDTPGQEKYRVINKVSMNWKILDIDFFKQS